MTYDNTDPRRFTCPTCGGDGSAYVAGGPIWRYTCGKGHTWEVRNTR